MEPQPAFVTFNVRGRSFSFGWLVALIVLFVCIVLLVVSRGGMDLWLITALAGAYVIG